MSERTRSERTRLGLFAAFSALLVFVATQPPKAAQGTRQRPTPRDFTLEAHGEFSKITQDGYRYFYIRRKSVIAVSAFPPEMGLDPLPHPTVIVNLSGASPFRIDCKTEEDAKRLVDFLIKEPK